VIRKMPVIFETMPRWRFNLRSQRVMVLNARAVTRKGRARPAE